MSTTESNASAASIAALRPRILHTAYFVANIERSLKFYRDLLGMQETQRFDLDGGVKEVILAFPDSKGAGVILMWNDARTAPYNRGDGYSRFVLMVSDLDAAMRELRAHDVPITKPATSIGPMTYCMIEDPDGYTIEVLQIRR